MKIKKASIWLMLELFFSISMITVFFFYLVNTIYSLKENKVSNEKIYIENTINNLFVLQYNGLLFKVIDDYNFYTLEKYLESLYPFTDKRLYIYDNSYIIFFVMDNNLNDLESIRYVKFHYFFPFNVNNKSIVIKSLDSKSLPTRVSFNYYYFKVLYLITSIADYNCTYLRANLENFEINQIKKLRIFLDNYEIKNFSWSIDQGDVVIKINEPIETGSFNKHYLYVYLTLNESEIGKQKSNSISIQNCLSITSTPLETTPKISNLGTIEFNYKLTSLPEEGKVYFYLNFISNKKNISKFYDHNVNYYSLAFYDNAVSIRNDKVFYGLTNSNVNKNWKIESNFIIPFYYKSVYHELHFVIYRTTQ